MVLRADTPGLKLHLRRRRQLPRLIDVSRAELTNFLSGVHHGLRVVPMAVSRKGMAFNRTRCLSFDHTIAQAGESSKRFPADQSRPPVLRISCATRRASKLRKPGPSTRQA